MSDTETEVDGTEEGTELDAPEAPDEDVTGDPDVLEEEEQIDGTDDGEEAEPEAPTEASAEAMVSGYDRQFRNIEKRASGYVAAAGDLIAETEQPILRCGFCLPALPGFIPSPAVQPWTPDQLSFARSVLGQPDEPPLTQGNDAHMCPDCNGWGQVLTGSKRNDQKSRKCFTCNGRGWEGRGSGEVQVSNGSAGLAEVPALELPPEDVPDKDPWGRPPGHPGFYKMPHPGMPYHELPPGMAQVAGA